MVLIRKGTINVLNPCEQFHWSWDLEWLDLSPNAREGNLTQVKLRAMFVF